MKTALYFLALCVFTGPVLAEQKKDYGDYEVHYAAMLTSDLSPEVARNHDIPRSGKRAFIMINARKLGADNQSESVPVSIEGKVSNLVGQVRMMKWQQVREDTAVYSLSHFPVTNEEKLTFRLRIVPEGGSRELPLEFRQTFYTE